MAWKFTRIPGKEVLCALLAFLAGITITHSQTLFQSTDAPVTPILNDGQPIETGVKFRASQAGFIRGVRYYKGAGSTGQHIGQLWSAAGTLMASVPFNNETASGWQEVLFNSPVAIEANVVYIAACYSSSGDYCVSNNYFTQPVINGPLRALANNEDGPNGVFIFSQIPMMPVNGFQANNYWVDVVYEVNNGPDVTPPSVIAVSPAPASTGASVSTAVTIRFNEALSSSSVSSTTFQLKETATNSIIATAITYNSSNFTVTLSPSGALSSSVMYSLSVKGGANGVKDPAGNALTSDYNSTFTTVDLPFLSPDEGYGGPLLVISDPAQPFTRYTAELLRSEGLTSFSVQEKSSISSSLLAAYDVILVGETSLSPAQVNVLRDWVMNGGTLIAFKPDASLAALCGLTIQQGVLSNRYSKINTTGPGQGIYGETMQYHGDASLYTLVDATALAILYENATTATTFPAASVRNVGNQGGKVIAFAYDLSRSVVYTRQGNPGWAGQERDGQAGPIRSNDLFFGLPANSGNDWIDFNKIAIPQADEQQRFLANIIIQNNMHRKPLPRLWYLPRQLKAAIVMTGDDHSVNGTAGRFDHYLGLGPNSPEDVANWNSVRSTSYIFPNTPLTDAQAATYQSLGFEIALHPNTGCSNYTLSSLNYDITTQLGSFTSAFPSISSPVTNRTHCLVWSDWVSHARAEQQHGMRMDANYYYWPDAWVQNRPGLFTGSGFPMRFADTSGALIDCYQLTTQMTDESGIHIANFCSELLSKATGPEGFYGTFCANMHTDSAQHIGSSQIIDIAQAFKIPVISAKQLLTWLDGRNNTRFENMNWTSPQLTFTVTAPSGARNMSGMLPLFTNSMRLVSVTRNGQPVLTNTETVKGIEYGFFSIATGRYNYVAKYELQNPLVITEHPQSQIACGGVQVHFSTAATGNGTPSVQWQRNTGGTWTNLAGETNDTLTIIANLADNGTTYRAIWADGQAQLISDSASLTVKPVPLLSSPVNNPAITSGSLFSYTASSSTPGTQFSWTRPVIPGISNAAGSGSGSILETLVNTTASPVTVTYTWHLSANGCTNSASIFVVVNPGNACEMTTSSTASFNSIQIREDRYIWFNSVFDPSTLPSNTTSRFRVTNSRINFTVNNQQTSLVVPDADIIFSNTVSIATTRFQNGKWMTEVPANYNGNVFMTGLSYQVPFNFPGNIRNVTWSATINSDLTNTSIQWKWTAGVYTNFANHPGLNIKPVDGLLYILNPLVSLGNAGTPLNFSLNVIAGAMGAGLLNITNTYSPVATANCIPASGILTTMRQKVVPITGEGSLQLELADKLDVNISPNPSNNYYTLRYRTSSPLTITIRNISGQVIEKYNQSMGTGILRLGAKWTAGAYFVTVIDAKGDKKVIKLLRSN